MTEIQNSKPQHHLKKKNPKYVWVIEYWNLRFICNLVLGIWDFRFWTADCEFGNLSILGTLAHFRRL
jgi:hypothetical protein